MALPNDASRMADVLAGNAASDPAFTNNTKRVGRRLIRRTYFLSAGTGQTNANGSNATLANANPCMRFPVAGRVLGVYATFASNATAAGGNNATISLVPLAAGVSGTTIATQTTNTSANGGTGNIVIGVPAALTVDLANNRYAANSTLAFQVAQNASGVAMGIGSYTIDVEEEDVLDSYPV